MSTFAAREFQRRRGIQVVLSASFVAALAVPNLDLAFGLDPNPSPLREVVPFPRLEGGRALRKLPGQLLWYLRSSMGFRGALVRAHGLFSARVLGVSPAPESVVMAEPWLFFRGERVLDDYRRVDPLSPQALEQWRTTLEARREWLTRLGIRYLVVVAPNKETVYAEQVPPWVNRASGPSRLEQLGAELRARSKVEFLDLTSTLVAHKPDGRLYHYTDTHWNDRGAFIGYRAVTERLSPWFPALSPTDPRDVAWTEAPARGGDLARICGLQTDLPEPEVQIRFLAPRTPATLEDGSPLSFERTDVRGKPRFVTRSPDGEVASAVIVRDSFGELLIPYLSRHFRSATWIWTYDFPSEEILASHPSVVIEQIVERKLMVIEPKNPPEVAAVLSGAP